MQFRDVANIATVKVNGIDCGTIWTAPHELDISKAERPGENKIEAAVTNTWANRLIGDERLPKENVSPDYRTIQIAGKPLLPAGLIGDVECLYRKIMKQPVYSSRLLRDGLFVKAQNANLSAYNIVWTLSQQ